jgi:hypothetical protein
MVPSLHLVALTDKVVKRSPDLTTAKGAREDDFQNRPLGRRLRPRRSD